MAAHPHSLQQVASPAGGGRTGGENRRAAWAHCGQLTGMSYSVDITPSPSSVTRRVRSSAPLKSACSQRILSSGSAPAPYDVGLLPV